MFPAYCSALGLAGWLLMLTFWVVLVALIVWGVTRLFPDPTHAATPKPPGAKDQQQPVGHLER